MAGEALRQVFAEFGFKVDDAPLEKMLADTERVQKAEESLSKTEKAVLADFRKSAAEKKRLAEKDADAKQKAEEEAKKKADEERKSFLDSIPGLRTLNSLKGSLGAQSLGLAAAIAAVVVSAHQFAAAFAADAMALRETADAARVTETQLQQVTFAASAVGVSAETATSGLNTLGEGLRAIEARTGGPTSALYRLGVRARNVDGTMRATNDVLLDLADRFERVRSPVHRARLAQELFGASGRRMMQVLAGGSAALRRQQEDFAALGGGVLPEAIEESRRFAVAQGRLGVAADSVRSVFATFLLPVFTRAANAAADLTGWFSRMTRGTHIANAAFVGLGVAGVAAATAVLVAWGPVVAPIAAVALGAIALSLAFDDVQNLLEGNESLVGYLIDQYAGFGAAARFVERIRDAWNGVVDALARVNEAVENLPAWARTGIDIATGGVRRLLPQERSAGAEGSEQPAEALPPGTTMQGRQRPAPRRQIRLTPTTPTIDRNATPAWMMGGAATAPLRAGAGARTINNSVNLAAGAIQVQGAGRDAPQIADEVMRRLEERARRQRDEAHPQDAEE